MALFSTKTKNMAHKAVNSLNERLMGGRKIEVSMAQAKKSYETTKAKSSKVSLESNTTKDTSTNGNADEDDDKSSVLDIDVKVDKKSG